MDDLSNVVQYRWRLQRRHKTTSALTTLITGYATRESVDMLEGFIVNVDDLGSVLLAAGFWYAVEVSAQSGAGLWASPGVMTGTWAYDTDAPQGGVSGV